MQQETDSYTIGALAQAAGVNVETVRFYQRKGLLREPGRPQGAIRRYAQADLARLGFIKAAQRLGFSLDEVSELLKLEDGASCRAASEKAQRKLADVRARLADLQRLEAVLAELVGRCESSRGKVHCPLIAALQEG